MEKGKIQIYCGEGHGKTTAAIGNAFREAFYGKSVIIIQFLKGKNPAEEHFFNRMEPEIKYFNFARAQSPYTELDEEKKQEEVFNQKNGFHYARKVILTGECDVIVLDELLGLEDLGLVSFDEIKNIFAGKPEEMSIICTGRVLDDRFRSLADEIYNIAPEK